MKRIVVVEDNAMNRMLVRELLEHHGYQIIEARDFEAAVRLLDDAPPDLFLLDVQIPGGGGEALLHAIRAREALAKVPVVAITAFAMAGDRARFLAAGFDEYISKPIDTGALPARLEAVIARGVG